MSALLLDAHVLYWLAFDSDCIPSGVRRRIEKAQRVYISAVSAYEVAQKHRLGKLPEAASLLLRWQDFLEALMAEELPLTTAVTMQAGSMQWRHRDPFDRMLVAQAQMHGLQIVTRDNSILAYPEANCAAWE